MAKTSADSKSQTEGDKAPKVKTTKAASSMEELLKSTGYQLKGLKKGDTVTATITRISAREIALDTGSKTEGVVMDKEIENYRDMLSKLKVGDTVTAQVIVAENDRGQSVLSIRKSLLEKRWTTLADVQKSGDSVDVVLRDPVRGGVLVDYGGIRGYIPMSQLDGTVAKQLDKSAGRRLKVKVIEVDPATNRLVFSQRAITEEAVLAKQKELLDVIPVDTTVEATITGVAPFGAFAKFAVEKDGTKHEVEGLIHISEIAWEKVDDPNQYLKAGDTIKVKIAGVDEKSGKVTLSVKQLLPDPWEHVLDMFEKDSQVKGKVTRVSPYGIFVELTPGVEGLIHISKVTPGTEPKVGEEITCLVEDVKPDQRKISLSMALTEKPIGYR
ncbi:S1 RNA-binding domain-containing protein [Patescibacteria group bacterium]|nr:S1 RNA-binding domain-containing protein [Patescibacteria group bacterium]